MTEVMVLKRKWSIFLIIAMLVIALPGCRKKGGDGNDTSEVAETYQIKYELGNAERYFADPPMEAQAGELVEIRTNGILLDADIHVYVDGQEIGKSHYDSDYWGYSFVMPEEDVLITAKIYSEGEIWGIGTDEATLREKFPEYFDLSTMKGLEVYVWQMAEGCYSFGLQPGTNREKTIEDLWDMKSATVEEMRIILASYDVDEDEVTIIPWQNPISSYIGGYWIGRQGESDEVKAARKAAYAESIRKMLFEDGEGPDND